MAELIFYIQCFDFQCSFLLIIPRMLEFTLFLRFISKQTGRISWKCSLSITSITWQTVFQVDNDKHEIFQWEEGSFLSAYVSQSIFIASSQTYPYRFTSTLWSNAEREGKLKTTFCWENQLTNICVLFMRGKVCVTRVQDSEIAMLGWLSFLVSRRRRIEIGSDRSVNS